MTEPEYAAALYAHAELRDAGYLLSLVRVLRHPETAQEVCTLIATRLHHAEAVLLDLAKVPPLTQDAPARVGPGDGGAHE